MRALIIVISILLGIAGLLLIVAAFLPAQYSISAGCVLGGVCGLL